MKKIEKFGIVFYYEGAPYKEIAFTVKAKDKIHALKKAASFMKKQHRRKETSAFGFCKVAVDFLEE